MWGGPGQSNSPDRFSGARRSSHTSMDGQDNSSPDAIAAAAIAARMAFANAYDSSGPPGAPVPPSYFDVYGNAAASSAAVAGQPPLHGDHDDAMYLQQQQQYQQRARELEFLHLQQQMRERQVYEHEARNRLLEHAALNQLQDYERSRMQLELMREMQQHEAMMEAERTRLQQEKAMEGQRDLQNNSINIWNVEQEENQHDPPQPQPQQHDYDDEEYEEHKEQPAVEKASPQPNAPQRANSTSPVKNTQPPKPSEPPLEKERKQSKPKAKTDATKARPDSNGSSKKAHTSAKKKTPSKKEDTQYPVPEGKSPGVVADSAIAKKKARPKKTASTSEQTSSSEKKAEKKTEKKAPSAKAKKSKPSSQTKNQPHKDEIPSPDLPNSKFQDTSMGTTNAATDIPSGDLNIDISQPKNETAEQAPSPNNFALQSPTDKNSPGTTEPAKSVVPKKEASSKKKRPKKKETSSSKAPLSTPLSSTETPSQVVSSSQIKSESEAKLTTPSEPKTPTSSRKRKKTPSSRAKESAKTPENITSSGNKSKKSKKSPASLGGKKVAAASLNSLLIKRNPGIPTIDDSVPPITDAEYENIANLMNEFCRVPFLAEFSRPVSLLHPELMELYSKIVHHPMDLGHVCRKIRRHEYKNTRAIQLDVWRVFSNCIKFHSHPSNRDSSVPSFISISMHLRDFFNNLWQEYMMPSDAPPRAPGKGISRVHAAFQKRAESRKERLLQVSASTLSVKCLQKAIASLESFISSGGKVDKIDKDATLGNPDNATGDTATFIDNLRNVISNIETRMQENKDEGYSVMEFHRDLKRTYTEDVFENQVLKKMHIGSRLDRIIGKLLIPIHEVNGRGVNQSSVWGCMAAAIWARESRKKPYWPAIVLGILAPEDQKEDWHQALTNRNEARLPEKLREQLLAGKRKADQALKKQSSDFMSYFLVEFMGSHEFIWVRESDIIENFDPEEDVNIASAAGNITKKKRSTASSFSTKAMSDAIEEGRWALEEFELQLNDTCGDGDQSDEDGDNEYAGYTYDMLCESDDEADEMESMLGLEEAEKSHESDIDEQNELLASDGLLDFSTEGRKKAKLRAAALKKQNAMRVKKEKEREKTKEKEEKAKKAKADQLKKMSVSLKETKMLERHLELEEKREKRELELRRKKRARDHERILKEEERKTKKSKTNTPEKKVSPNEIPNKRGRAEAMVKAFLVRKFMSRELKDVNFNGDGALFQPQSTVETSGLLSMALAFRAAAGEIPFVDSTGKAFVIRDWENIDSKSPLTSSERCECLQKQILLIKEEINRVNGSTEQRLALIKDAEQALCHARSIVFDAEQEARTSNVKKKKKSPKKSASSKDATKEEKANGDNDSTVDHEDEKPSKSETLKEAGNTLTDDENEDSSD